MGKIEQGAAIDEAISYYHVGIPSPSKLTPTLQRKFDLYRSDEKNQSVIQSSIQQKIDFRFAGNHYFGIIDQMREADEKIEVWEVKYSDVPPLECLHYYLTQLLIYAYALQVYIGGIINVKNYGTTDPVFFCVDYHIPTSKDMELLNAAITSSI